MTPRIFLVLALTLVTGAAYAENKEGGRPPGKGEAGRPPGKGDGRGERKEHDAITISKVSGESITIGEGAKEKTYKINKSTEVTVKGQKAKVEDLKEGMKVSVNMGSDPTVASRISASDAPKEGERKDGDRKGDGERKRDGDAKGEKKGDGDKAAK